MLKVEQNEEKRRKVQIECEHQLAKIYISRTSTYCTRMVWYGMVWYGSIAVRLL